METVAKRTTTKTTATNKQTNKQTNKRTNERKTETEFFFCFKKWGKARPLIMI